MSVTSPPRGPRRLRWGSLMLALLCLGLAVAAFTLLPGAINTAHTTTGSFVPQSAGAPPTATPQP